MTQIIAHIICFFLIVQARKPRTDKLTSSLLKSERRNDPEHSQEQFRVSPQHRGSQTKSSLAMPFILEHMGLIVIGL